MICVSCRNLARYGRRNWLSCSQWAWPWCSANPQASRTALSERMREAGIRFARAGGTAASYDIDTIGFAARGSSGARAADRCRVAEALVCRTPAGGRVRSSARVMAEHAREAGLLVLFEPSARASSRQMRALAVSADIIKYSSERLNGDDRAAIRQTHPRLEIGNARRGRSALPNRRKLEDAQTPEGVRPRHCWRRRLDHCRPSAWPRSPRRATG
jgi:hypothetical protein